ncbi:hypothetical protein J3R83DRAFT_8735 [Lanmaoa asiatica]|nr:hypothetical protein J3R83DRAFT_8735 [Lanmaoa asiatica]
MPSFPYVIINAFTRSPLGGNPAAVALLPPGTLTLTPRASVPIVDTPTMIAIAKSLAQPIAVFVASPSPPTSKTDGDDDAFDIQFFVNDYAPRICGHGTLATTKAICKDLLQGLDANREDAALRFRTPAGLVIRASAVPRPRANADDDDGELYEIELPVIPVEPLLGRTQSVLSLDEELDGQDVNIRALLDAGLFGAISLSHLTPGKAHAFESRVFAPANGVLEDQVCGSVHTLMVPCYASLRESRVEPGQQAYVRQVSPQGGDLWVTFDEGRQVVVFRGNAKLFAKGELIL